MAAASSPSIVSTCPDCGCSLWSRGICPTCAFAGLLSDSSSLPVQNDTESLDVEFGRYTLKERLASGGMGVVYAAEDRQLKRTVALKMIKGATFANDVELSRFTVEAEAAAALDHPNIVPVHEVGTIEGQPFFTMKLISGGNLSTRLKQAQDRRLPLRDAAQYLSQIARAVHHAHQRGVLHRDLKPANILIDTDGKPWLTDFGLAKIVHGDRELTLTKDHLGTPNYMAPEMVQGSAREISTASDVWALGVILWECLCGISPFQGSSPVGTMRKIVEEEPSSASSSSSLNRDLLTLAQRCLEKDPKCRITSASEVADELDRWLRGEPVLVRRITSGERLWKWVKRKPVWAALAVTLVIGAFSSLQQWQRAELAVESLTESLTIAAATKLAMQARMEVEENASRALLLAAESVDMAERSTGEVLPVAAEALYRTLQEVGGTDLSPLGMRVEGQFDGYIHRSAPREYPIRFSPDGSKALLLDPISQPQVSAAIYAFEGSAEPRLHRRWPIWKSKAGSVCHAVAWLSDSQSLVTVEPDGAVHLWEPDGKPGSTDEVPKKRMLGQLNRPGETLFRVWLTQIPGSHQLSGVAYYVSDLVPTSNTLTFFTIAPDEDRSVNERSAHSLMDIQGLKSAFWVMSPTRKWIFIQAGERVFLVRLNAAEGGSIDWVPLPAPSAVVEEPVGFFGNERWLVRQVGQRIVKRLDLCEESLDAVVASTETLVDHEIGVNAFALSLDGSYFAFADERAEITLLSLDDHQQSQWSGVGREKWLKLQFSKDGHWLAAGGIEHAVTLWPLALGSRRPVGQPKPFRGLPSPTLDIVFTPETKGFITYGVNAHFRHWSLDGKPCGALPEFISNGRDPINDLVVSRDGRWSALACAAASSTEQGLIKLVKLGEPEEIVLGNHQDSATGVALSRDQRWLASVGKDGVGQVWNFPEVLTAINAKSPLPEPCLRFDMTEKRLGYERQLAFHPSGRLYVTCGDGFLFEWDLTASDPLATGLKHRLHSNGYLLPDVISSPDGRWLAVARHGWDPIEEGKTQWGNMVLLYDVSNPEQFVFRTALPAHFMDITNLDISADNRWLAAGAAGKGATIWDLTDTNIEKSVRVSKVTDHQLKAVAFSPDSHWLGLGGSDGRFHLWNWQNDHVRTISTDTAVGSLDWLSDSRVVAGNAAGQIAVWETDVIPLTKRARALAGRELTGQERERFRIH